MHSQIVRGAVTVKWNLPDVTSYLVAGLLVGPILTKVALTAAGDIQPKPEITRGQGVEHGRNNK